MRVHERASALLPPSPRDACLVCCTRQEPCFTAAACATRLTCCRSHRLGPTKGACSAAAQKVHDSIVQKLEASQTSTPGEPVAVYPFFDTDGSIQIQWAGAYDGQTSNDDMSILSGTHVSDRAADGYNPKCDQGVDNVCNFYVSTDDGKTFTKPKQVHHKILDVQYSRAMGNSEAGEGKYAVFATVEDGGVHGLYHSEDGGANWDYYDTKDYHFSYIIPSPKNAGRFIGLEFSGSSDLGDLYTMHVCTGIFTDNHLSCADRPGQW